MDKVTITRDLLLKHIITVQQNLDRFCSQLMQRAMAHDKSKLEPLELEAYSNATETLEKLEYGSEEYTKATKEILGPALEHHYAQPDNRHHPEHFERGVRGMNLVDLVEMFCDWQAAAERGRKTGGDIRKSIAIGKEKYDLSDELSDILLNTADYLESVYPPPPSPPALLKQHV